MKCFQISLVDISSSFHREQSSMLSINYLSKWAIKCKFMIMIFSVAGREACVVLELIMTSSVIVYMMTLIVRNFN